MCQILEERWIRWKRDQEQHENQWPMKYPRSQALTTSTHGLQGAGEHSISAHIAGCTGAPVTPAMVLSNATHQEFHNVFHLDLDLENLGRLGNLGEMCPGLRFLSLNSNRLTDLDGLRDFHNLLELTVKVSEWVNWEIFLHTSMLQR